MSTIRLEGNRSGLIKLAENSLNWAKKILVLLIEKNKFALIITDSTWSITFLGISEWNLCLYVLCAVASPLGQPENIQILLSFQPKRQLKLSTIGTLSWSFKIFNFLTFQTANFVENQIFLNRHFQYSFHSREKVKI